MKITDTIGLLIWVVFFALHFFATQGLYRSRYFYGVQIVMFSVSIVLFFILDKKYPELKFQFSAFLVFHYSFLLVLIRLSYRSLNMALVKRHCISSAFIDKDFTYVTHAFEGLGDDIWDRKQASKPSWLDYFLSYSLLFVPIFLTLLTMHIMRGG
jgi:hypothetical protein